LIIHLNTKSRFPLAIFSVQVPMPATISNLVYARIEERALTLDLYLPEPSSQPIPLVIWIHGGAWRSGDKSWCDEVMPLLAHGYAIASIDYRLSQEALFPAQICDVKAAVRWLRLHAADWNLDPKRFAAAGSSAGGHLAVLLGASFYYRDWDLITAYTEAAPPEISSAVQAVVDWFGPVDFSRMNDTPGSLNHLAPDSPEAQLIGGAVQEYPERASGASPITYVYPGYPPFLLLHGDHDRTVIPEQSILLFEALRKWACPVEFSLIPGEGHGFEGANYQFALSKTSAFLQEKLRAPSQPQSVYYACTEATFRPRTRHAVRWLNPHSDYILARDYWGLLPGNDLSHSTWMEAHDLGYSYAGVLHEERLVSVAAVWRYSAVAWELAAVSTVDPAHRQHGNARSTCSFITNYILGTGRVATVQTHADNHPMRRTAESIGFRLVA
jgi:acetyl esterase/lipase